MKLSTQTASTHLYTPKQIGEFNPYSNDRRRSSQKVIENTCEIDDLAMFQQQMNRIQQKVILTQISKYHQMNIQKQFPPLLKQLQQQSQKLITLENRHSTIISQHLNEQAKAQQIQQQMQQQKEHLQQKLFDLESNNLLQQQYEKQLILANVDCLQSKVKQLMQDREDKSVETTIVMQRRNVLLREIQDEKQVIMKLAIKKGEIQEEINFVKTCQLEPIHLVREKSLKLYQAKVKLFQKRFIVVGAEKGQCAGLITNYCQNIQSVNQQEFAEMIGVNHSKCINEGWGLQQRLIQLQKSLNMISAAKIQIIQYINIENLRNNILTQQIDQKNLQVQKYQHLLTNVQNQQYCIETIQDNYEIEKQVVKDSQIEQKVNNQLCQNELLKKKLNQLVERLNGQRQANMKLNRLLSEVKIDHQVRTNKLIAENDVFKSKLQTKKKIYENKIQLNEPIVSVFTRQKSFEKGNYNSGKTKYYKEKTESYPFSGIKPYLQEQRLQWGMKSVSNEFQNINLINRRVQPSKQSPSKQQSLQCRMNELRQRMMRKFQEAEHMKK